MGESVGRKNDDGKLRWNLMPWKPVEEVVQVLTYGAKKYDDHNWQQVPNAKARYFSAAMRHLVAWTQGERADKESGIHHLGHAICCLIFLRWFDGGGYEKNL